MRALALAALLGTGSCAAQDMRTMELVSGGENSKWFLRKDRYDKTATGVAAWVYVYLDKPGPIFRPPNRPDLIYANSVTRYFINCSNSTYALGPSTYYDRSGLVVYGDEGNPYAYKTPLPDTHGDHIILRACAADSPFR